MISLSRPKESSSSASNCQEIGVNVFQQNIENYWIGIKSKKVERFGFVWVFYHFKERER